MALNIRQKGLVRVYLETGKVKVGKEEKTPQNTSEACSLIGCSFSDFQKHKATLETRKYESNRKKEEA